MIEIKKDRVEKVKRILTPTEKKKLKELQEERDWLEELIANEPTNTILVRRYHETGIKIVALTGEKTIDY